MLRWRNQQHAHVPPLHLGGGVFWRPHPGALLKPPAERLINANARIRRCPYRRKKEVTYSKYSVLIGGLVSLVIADRERRSPTEEPQKTRRRFVLCRPDQRWSREPSTSEGGAPGGTEATHVVHRRYWDRAIDLLRDKTHIAFADIVGVFVDIPRQAKVTDLHHIVL